jgi:hypothetical protein
MLLLVHGADPNIKGRDGMSALQIASRNGDLKLVDVLLDAGVNVSFRNDAGLTAADIARQKGFEDIVKRIAAVSSTGLRTRGSSSEENLPPVSALRLGPSELVGVVRSKIAPPFNVYTFGCVCCRIHQPSSTALLDQRAYPKLTQLMAHLSQIPLVPLIDCVCSDPAGGLRRVRCLQQKI